MPTFEEWKAFPDDPSIEASTFGRIRYVDGGEIKTHYRKGYHRVSGSMLNVHRIIAKTFIPNPLNLPAVNHKDNVKNNNKVENLEWITIGDNIRHAAALGVYQGSHHFRATLDDIQALAVFTCFANPEIRFTEIAKAFNSTYVAIAHMAKGNSWHIHREISGYIPAKRSARKARVGKINEMGGHA